MDERHLPDVPRRQRQYAAVGLAVVSVGWLVAGILISVGLQGVPFWLAVGAVEPGTGGSTLQGVVGAFAFLLLLAFSVLTAGDYRRIRGSRRGGRVEP